VDVLLQLTGQLPLAEAEGVVAVAGGLGDVADEGAVLVKAAQLLAVDVGPLPLGDGAGQGLRADKRGGLADAVHSVDML